jgi:hypothetical protein
MLTWVLALVEYNRTGMCTMRLIMTFSSLTDVIVAVESTRVSSSDDNGNHLHTCLSHYNLVSLDSTYLCAINQNGATGKVICNDRLEPLVRSLSQSA